MEGNRPSGSEALPREFRKPGGLGGRAGALSVSGSACWAWVELGALLLLSLEPVYTADLVGGEVPREWDAGEEETFPEPRANTGEPGP